MTGPRAALRAFYLDTAGGARFCVHHRPMGQPVRGSLLYVHPFAEEMNKARRMAGVAARAFAAAGFEVLAIDLYGCGDSTGDFGDATWSHWVDDVREAHAWLQRQADGRPSQHWLWGLRAGCLLALDALRQMPAGHAAPHLLFWQPPVQGKALAQQFLRLRLAAEALRESPLGSELTPSTQASGDGEIAGANSQEVAGYRVQPDLLAGLRQSSLLAPLQKTRSAWLEVTTRDPTQLLPGTERAVAEWAAAGHEVHARAVPGPGFWQTQEIEEAPALVAASLDAMLAVEGTARSARHGA